MNVLSLFDGMSCGQIALNRIGVKYDKYYASEIDQAGIKVTLSNFPNTIQLGDVTKVTGNKVENIGLLLAGSPCQGFSFAGKQLNFDDPRSKLFFEFVRLLKELKPRYFLLENVLMKKEYEQVISDHLGVNPVFINSQLVSAHDRKRLYWTNIPFDRNIPDRKIQLIDILDSVVDDSLYLKDEIARRYLNVTKPKIDPSKSCVIGKLSPYQGDRVFDVTCKGSSLSASGGNNGGGSCNIIFDPKTNRLRKLSVAECERLQTVSEGYVKTAPETQGYKMLGNGWTVDVIAHILSFLPKGL